MQKLSPRRFSREKNWVGTLSKTGTTALVSFTVTEQQLRTVAADGTRSFVRGEYDLVVTNGALNSATHRVSFG